MTKRKIASCTSRGSPIIDWCIFFGMSVTSHAHGSLSYFYIRLLYNRLTLSRDVFRGGGGVIEAMAPPLREHKRIRMSYWCENLTICQIRYFLLYKHVTNVFLTIYALLNISVVIPVSTAPPERTFSALRLLKTYLRNRTSESRLNGLAHMYLNSTVSIDVNDVINRFASQKNRRLVL